MNLVAAVCNAAQASPLAPAFKVAGSAAAMGGLNRGPAATSCRRRRDGRPFFDGPMM